MCKIKINAQYFIGLQGSRLFKKLYFIVCGYSKYNNDTAMSKSFIRHLHSKEARDPVKRSWRYAFDFIACKTSVNLRK